MMAIYPAVDNPSVLGGNDSLGFQSSSPCDNAVTCYSLLATVMMMRGVWLLLEVMMMM